MMNRGNGGEYVVERKADKLKFLEYLDMARERFGVVIHSYCLMSNHYHLLVETPEANLSRAIQWLNVSYATWYNRKKGRRGHLFQGRFKAIIIDKDVYLKELSRYIHRNPVRANMIDLPEQYPWSSYRVFIGQAKIPDFLEIDWLLGRFGKTRKEAYARYKKFVDRGSDDPKANPHTGLVGGVILGRDKFVQWIRDTYLNDREDEKEIPQLRHLKPRAGILDIFDAVIEETGSTMENLLKKGGKKNVERDLAIWLARNLSGKSCEELGLIFGGVSGAAITMRTKIFAEKINKDKGLRKKTEEIKVRILNN